MASAKTPEVRRVLCTSCDAPLTIAATAKSISCPHCHQRVVTEAVTVKDYVAVRKFFIANAMRITKKGLVYASVRADDLRVDGFLQGDALALGRMHLGKSARVQGDIRATFLRVDAGAAVTGQARIGPGAVEEIACLADAPPEAVGAAPEGGTDGGEGAGA